MRLGMAELHADYKPDTFTFAFVLQVVYSCRWSILLVHITTEDRRRLPRWWHGVVTAATLPSIDSFSIFRLSIILNRIMSSLHRRMVYVLALRCIYQNHFYNCIWWFFLQLALCLSAWIWNAVYIVSLLGNYRRVKIKPILAIFYRGSVLYWI